MSVDQAELSREQDYFDAAWAHRERMRSSLTGAAGAAANSGAAARINQDAKARRERLGKPDEAVAFARMDDESGETLYLGYHAIFDDESNIVVVNWQAPAATAFHKATHADPCGLRLKREFSCKGNQITSFSDVILAQLSAEIAELTTWTPPSDTLLRELERNRTGSMQDIVRTIQAAQYELIQAPLDSVMVVQGGPGTGKTAIALHRVSWLLFNHPDRLSERDILIVGPNPTFTRYTRAVLPSLGDTGIEQLDIHKLHPPVRQDVERAESAELMRLKGDLRMSSLVERALYARVGLAENQQHVRLTIERQKISLPSERVAGVIARCLDSAGTYAERRQLFRQLLLEMVFDLLAVKGSDQLRRSGPSGLRSVLDPIMERIWPSASSVALLRDLYGSRDRLLAAAGDKFTAREVSLLHRRAADKISDETWTNADLAILDEVEALINGVERKYHHIVIDEAQDLSPMQLRSIARRSANSSFTVVGDIAQSTGQWARDEWSEVVRHLPSTLPVRFEDLHYGYRVPRQVFEFAAQLLPIAAPAIKAPQVVRDGPADPSIHQVDDEDERAVVAVRVAMGHAAHGRSVAIICPDASRKDLERELSAKDVAWRAASEELGAGVNVVRSHEAKGLEFDAVVVLEPADIIAEDVRGHRLLYVALTRTTRYLDIVCAGSPLPIGADVDPTPVRPTTQHDETDPAPTAPPRDVEPGSPGSQFLRLLDDPNDADPTPATTATPKPAPAVETAEPSIPAPRGKASTRLVTAAAEDLIDFLRENVAPNHWPAILAKATELISEPRNDL